MAFGKLYSYLGNPRTTAILVVAKENKLDLELIPAEPAKGLSADYKRLNKLGKVPTFVGTDGYTLTECIAIAIYITSQNEKTALLGKTKQDYASILRWMSFANSELLPAMGGWFRPLIGREPYNKKSIETAQARTARVVGVLEDHFLVNTYLVGERLTLADIFCASLAARGFEFVLDSAWRQDYPSFVRWFETVVNQPIYKSVAGEVKLIDEAVKYTPPAKAPKQEQAKPKAAPAAKAAPVAAAAMDDDEDDKPAAPKAKHPLEALGKPTFTLDDWKRKYSNEETREVALPWFWESANFDEYSLWQVDYKYNDELTMTFMTANLIGGFFARLEASRKYIFGAASVYGVTNDSVVRGAFFIRGQEAMPAFDVAPDYESYEFKKLDPKSAADQQFVNDQWAWDKPLVVGGKTYEWADGKVFK